MTVLLQTPTIPRRAVLAHKITDIRLKWCHGTMNPSASPATYVSTLLTSVLKQKLLGTQGLAGRPKPEHLSEPCVTQCNSIWAAYMQVLWLGLIKRYLRRRRYSQGVDYLFFFLGWTLIRAPRSCHWGLWDVACPFPPCVCSVLLGPPVKTTEISSWLFSKMFD